MARIRTIEKAYKEIKALDPNTSITKHFLRQMVISGEIKSTKAGTKYLINLDEVLLHMSLGG